jgi:MFS family permease
VEATKTTTDTGSFKKSTIKKNFLKSQSSKVKKKHKPKEVKKIYQTKLFKDRSIEAIKLLWPLLLLTVAVSVVAKVVGPFKFAVAGAEMEVLPIVWAILLGSLISCQTFVVLPKVLQRNSNAIMKMTLLVLMAALSFQVGPNIAKVMESGLALIFQEAGHFFGTIILAFPLAMFLGMGKATIGATFSIDREASIAIVANKYGLESPEYRGLLSMFVFGSLFGAVFISFVASFTANLGWFSPQALALGAGIGSGSMMAAASSAIISVFPDQAGEILALAATANVITMAVGIYVGIYVSLPLVDKLYHFFTKREGSFLRKRNHEWQWTNEEKNLKFVHKVKKYAVLADSAGVPKDYKSSIIYNWQSLLFINIAGLILSAIRPDDKFQYSFFDAVICFIVIDIIVIISSVLSRLFKEKIPAVVFIVFLGALITSDFFANIFSFLWVTNCEVGIVTCAPVNYFYMISQTIPFSMICILVMALAGLGIGKELDLLKRIGWKIIPVGLVAILSSYFFSVIIAEFTLGQWSF